ncbi:hypothetical protein MD484_g3092, partial [Candolleomyces efflorescens]
MAHLEMFPNSQGVNTGDIVTNIFPPAVQGVDHLDKLESRITAAAIHDSAERCDAPKCHRDTRVAVQDDLYDWILKGDPVSESEQPRKIKWVTGPAGCGKTAIMGSLSVRCASDGILGATFFFASWSATLGRRRKTTFVTTLARQLAMYRDDLRTAISDAIEKNPTVFEKNLHIQMEILVSGPLREVAAHHGRPQLQGAIIIDERASASTAQPCASERAQIESHKSGVFPEPEARADLHPARANEKDQLEILQVLQAASSDPSFPFRILIASRPERVFRNFFAPPHTSIPFAHKVDLHEQYDADADIALFLEAQFNHLRRQYNFLPSWPPPGTVQKLVENASGQFVYAATVIRLLDTPHREPPEALLRAILEAGATQQKTSSPLEQLDALYARILESSPDPRLSIQWIRSIIRLNNTKSAFASSLNLLLQTDPESNEAEHLLGNLHSLIQIPPPGDQATTKYGFYHKSLFDFLGDRCGSGNNQNLYFGLAEIEVFIWDRFVEACMTMISKGGFIDRGVASSLSKVHITPAGAAWWVSLAITHREGHLIWWLFQSIHASSSVQTGVLDLEQGHSAPFGIPQVDCTWITLAEQGRRLRE